MVRGFDNASDKTRRYHIALTLDLFDDSGLIAAYENWHRPDTIWPEVVDALKRTGMVDMQIWRLGERLVMTAEVEADYPRPLTKELRARLLDWERLMDRYQQRHSDMSPGDKWRRMKPIFNLGESARLA